jgi:hypothetical protein
MPHLVFWCFPFLQKTVCTVFVKIVVVEESPIFTAADEYSLYVWRHSVPYEVFGCEHIVRLAISVLGDSSTALIPSSCDA